MLFVLYYYMYLLQIFFVYNNEKNLVFQMFCMQNLNQSNQQTEHVLYQMLHQHMLTNVSVVDKDSKHCAQK